MSNKPLLTRQNAKTVKGEAKNWLTMILYLAPANTSGRNVCANSTPGCRAACLFTAGRGAYNNVREARFRKTREFYADKSAFIAKLSKEIRLAEKLATRKGMKLAIRLNGSSDLPFENLRTIQNPFGHSFNLMEWYPEIQFYDYTKNFARMTSFLAGNLPANYHLTFSRSETNDAECQIILKHGGNVAIVTPKGLETDIPNSCFGARQFTNGDTDDLRFLDKPGSCVILKAKGKAKKDQTGFVWRAATSSEIPVR